MSTSGVAAFGRTRDVEVGARGVLADPVARAQRVQRLIPMKQREAEANRSSLPISADSLLSR
jgi:hypothetical protein